MGKARRRSPRQVQEAWWCEVSIGTGVIVVAALAWLIFVIYVNLKD